MSGNIDEMYKTEICGRVPRQFIFIAMHGLITGRRAR
jgi:hypothetical protein